MKDLSREMKTLKNELCNCSTWNCIPHNSYIEFRSVALFGDGVLTGMIKLKQGH